MCFSKRRRLAREDHKTRTGIEPVSFEKLIGFYNSTFLTTIMSWNQLFSVRQVESDRLQLIIIVAFLVTIAFMVI